MHVNFINIFTPSAYIRGSIQGLAELFRMCQSHDFKHGGANVKHLAYAINSHDKITHTYQSMDENSNRTVKLHQIGTKNLFVNGS